jgi:hypothetical protein
MRLPRSKSGLITPISSISRNHKSLTDSKLAGLQSFKITDLLSITSPERLIHELIFFHDDLVIIKESRTMKR